jgi:ribonuclease E
MTEQTDPAGAAVQAPPGVDAGETASELGADPGTTAAGAKPRTRRGRRGGRGRRGSGTRARTSSVSGTGDGASAPAVVESPEVDAVSGDGSRDASDGPVEARSTTTSAARRRRRRGGRGRGPRAGGSAATAAGDDSDATDEELPDLEPRPELAAAEEIAEEEDSDVADVHEVGDGAATTAAKRRRRRGGRGRGRKRPTATEGQAPEVADGTGSEAAGAEPDRAAGTRSRPRRGGSKADTAADADEAEPKTRTRARRSRTKKGEGDADGRERSAVGTAGPTRLRRGRATSGGTRRRREPMPIAPRVTDKLMAITEHGDRDQIAILEERALVQHYVTRAGAKSMVGNVYLGRVQNVLPGMEAAFVDVGRGRNAVLYAGEVNYAPEDLEGKQPPRIEQVLKSGQSVLVQVTKDPIGGKGARLTAKVSMPGRYLVLQPNWEITGISKRLEDAERKRLRALLKKIRPEGHGLIVRTAAEEATEEDLRADVDRLLAEWTTIENKAKRAKAPAVLYEEPELTVKVVRDLFTDEEYRELVTDSERVYTLVTEYLSKVAPDLLPKVRLHTGKLPVFEEFHIVEQIHKGLDRKVWLPSGGYLVIDRTEAMTVIDVNTGKSVGKSNLEETVVNTNLEAARELARQLRLRDIGGMIIIDFIDMLLEQNKRRVVDTVKEEMARDKTRSQVFDISPLGLLEVTRKRVSGGLLESFSETCPTCEGRGVILTYEA